MVEKPVKMVEVNFKGQKVPIIVMLFPGQSNKAPRLHRECYILSKAGYRIHIIDIKGREIESPNAKLELENVTVHHIALPGFFSYEKTGNALKQALKIIEWLIHYFSFYIVASLLLLRLSNRYRIICIHCNHLHVMPVGVIFKNILRCKLIYDAYEFYYFYFKRHAPKLLVSALRKIEEKLAPRADLTVVCWRSQKLFLQSRYNVQNVVIFPNLPVPNYFMRDESHSDIGKEFGISSDDFVVFYGGGLGEHYKLDQLLEAFNIIVNNCKVANAKLVIAGSGHRLRVLKGMAKRLKIEKNVLFLGRVPYQDMPRLYQTCDVVYAMYDPVLDHLLGVKQKIFEAMICGKPVITLSIGENAKLVKRAKCGLTIKPEMEEIAKALLNFINDEKMRKIMGRNGYHYFIKNFSWERYAKNLICAYKKLLLSDWL